MNNIFLGIKNIICVDFFQTCLDCVKFEVERTVYDNDATHTTACVQLITSFTEVSKTFEIDDEYEGNQVCRAEYDIRAHFGPVGPDFEPKSALIFIFKPFFVINRAHTSSRNDMLGCRVALLLLTS